jgi:hypothetical protein
VAELYDRAVDVEVCTRDACAFMIAKKVEVQWKLSLPLPRETGVRFPVWEPKCTIVYVRECGVVLDNRMIIIVGIIMQLCGNNSHENCNEKSE